jgi:surface antigen
MAHRIVLTQRRAAAAALAAFMAMLPVLGSVARAQSAYGTDQRYCDTSALSQILSTSRGNLVGSAAGGALGGLLGSKMGGGSGSTALTLLGVLGGALAGGYIGRTMDPTDQACVGQTLEHTPTNQSVAWQNPDKNASYWVTPVENYQGANGQPCRRYITQAVVDGRTERTENTACREANGGWREASAGPGAAAPPPRQYPSREGALSRDTVMRVQARLHDLGFYVRDNIDGRWGPNTRAAVENFQRTKGISPTGQLDERTLAALGLSSEQGEAPR